MQYVQRTRTEGGVEISSVEVDVGSFRAESEGGGEVLQSGAVVLYDGVSDSAVHQR